MTTTIEQEEKVLFNTGTANGKAKRVDREDDESDQSKKQEYIPLDKFEKNNTEKIITQEVAEIKPTNTIEEEEETFERKYITGLASNLAKQVKIEEDAEKQDVLVECTEEEAGKDSYQRSNSNNVNIGLGVFYTSCGCVLSIFAGRCGLSIHNVRLLFMSLWMGFVLAISFMESWLKFRAPFVPRHLALDIGRHVFPALNAMEIAMCFCQWFLLILYKYDLDIVSLQCLMLLTLILVLEVFVYTPRLVLRGKKIVLGQVKRESSKLSVEQKRVINVLEKELLRYGNKSGVDSPRTHIIYILMEVAKVSLGFVFIGYHLS